MPDEPLDPFAKKSMPPANTPGVPPTAGNGDWFDSKEMAADEFQLIEDPSLLAPDPADAIAELPPIAPTSPASGWIDSSVKLPPPAPATPPSPTSDILDDIELVVGESDVIRGLTEPSTGNSRVFDESEAGSARFENPDDATDDGSPSSPRLAPLSNSRLGDVDLFNGMNIPYTDAELSTGMVRPDETHDSPAVPPSDVIRFEPLPKAEEPSNDSGDGRLDFNQIDPNESGSALFHDSSINEMFGESGVNLLSPEDETIPPATTSESSIFDAPGPRGFDASMDDMAAGLLAEDEFEMEQTPVKRSTGDSTIPDDSFTDVGTNANVFDNGSIVQRNDEEVDLSGEYPRSSMGDSTSAIGGMSGVNIVPGDSMKGWEIEDLKTSSEEDATGLASDAPAAPVPPPSKPSGKSPKTKSKSKPKPEPEASSEEPVTPAPRKSGGAPAKKGGALGWIAGGALGLLVGVGASAGAYFGGLIEPEKPKAVQPIVQNTGASQVELTEAKNARDELQGKLDAATTETATLKTDLATLKTDLATAKTTATTATDDLAKLKGTLATATKEVTDAKKAAETAMEEVKTALAAVTKLEKEKKTATDDLAVADAKLKDAMKALDTANTDKTVALKEVTDAKKLAETKAAEVVAAQKQLADATSKLKSADDALALVVKELKSNKLVEDKADAATVLAKLPEVMKTAATAASSADAQKAAAAIAAVKKDLETARADAKKYTDELVITKAAADKAKLDADKAVLAAKTETKDALTKIDTETKKAALAAEEAAKTKIDTLSDMVKKAQLDTLAERKLGEEKLTALQTQHATTLAAKEESYRKQLADVRSGAVVPLTSTELAAKDRAARDFTTGVDRYFAGRFADAEELFAKATKTDATDARLWYFLALSQVMQGKSGETAFKTGAEWEGRNQPPTRQIDVALERIQGTARRQLDTFRP